MSWNRISSVLVAIGYIVLAAIFGGAELAFKAGPFLVMPPICIWFSDAIGAYTGFLPLGDYPITQQSPGILICITGWVLLLLPITSPAIVYRSI